MNDASNDAVLWKRAIKVPMYTVALVPLVVAGAIAYAQTGVAQPLAFARLLLASVLVIAWLNLSNDAFDADTGVDADGRKPESVVNLLGGTSKSAQRVIIIANACLAAGAALFASACMADVVVAKFLALAVACGYVYQGPPFRLSYLGLGEPLCFVAFGPLAVSAFYRALTAAGAAATATITTTTTTGLCGVCAFVVGITTTSILLCSHFHQVDGDAAIGKKSPAVRLGTANASAALTSLVAAVYISLLGALYEGIPKLETVPTLVALLASLPSAVDLIRFVRTNHDRPEIVFRAKLYAIKWHSTLGFALAASLALPRLVL